MINIKDIHWSIIHIIYLYGGANVFYLNKELLLKINELREEFNKFPIKLQYKTIQWKHRSVISHYIINTKTNSYRRSIKVNNEVETIDISGGIIGYMRNDYIIPYLNFKKKLIPKEFLEDKNNFYRLNEGITYDIYKLWCEDNRINKYLKLWV